MTLVGPNAARRALPACALMLAVVALPAHAANRAIEEVRLARQGGVATVDVVLVCPVDYLDHVPAAGPEVRVRVELAGECAEAIGFGIRSELHEPPRSTVAAIRQVRFDTRDGREGHIVVTVSPAQRFSVRQGRARNVIHIELRPPDQPLPDTSVISGPTPMPAPSVDVPAAPPAAAPPPRQPLRLVPRSRELRERFALQLAAGPSVTDATALGAEHTSGRSLYVNEHGAGAARWGELRLGFFTSEQEARAAAATLPEAYAHSIVVVADAAEQERALAAAVSRAPERGPASAETPSSRPAPLTQERIAALTAQANDAMLDADHDTAIRLYARLLEDPNFAERRLARERLGLARERKGQLAQARAEYQAYLDEFPGDEGAERVRQRLAGLAATTSTAVETVAAAEPRDAELRAAPSRWDVSGGMAQYVRHLALERPGTTAATAEHSALLSNVNLVVRRDGERFDLTHRFDAAYHYNLLEATESSAPGDQLHVSNAYVDVTDGKHDWEARLGRQSRYGSGIVGRFDGAHVRYQWQPEIALNLALGYPVDYPRRAIETQRQFVGFSADLDQLVRQWDFSFFGIVQTVGGLADREAIGAEARYRSERWHVVGAIDADVSYSVLNSALVNATWRLTDKLTLNGRFNSGAAPYIATRNSLIGQSAVTVDTLLDSYSEAQLRTIARDRTAQAEQGTIGLSRPVFDRFQLHADAGWYDFEGSVSSGGVMALPGVQQTFLYLAFVGSSLFKDGDSAVFALRHTAARDVSNDVLTFDVRLPTRGRLRLNPRLALSSRQYADGTSQQWTAAPMLKLALRWPKRHQFELELGVRQSTRELAALGALAPPPDEELTETFINAGYWWELAR